jgi:hypothetical protein
MSRLLFMFAGMIVVLALGFVLVSAMKTSTVDACIKTQMTSYNDTVINGSGTHYLLLAHYIPGTPGSINISGAPGNYSLNGYAYNGSYNIVPAGVLGLNAVIAYNGVNVSNTSVTYTGLGNCSMSDNGYKSLSFVLGAGNMLIYIGFFVALVALGAFIVSALGFMNWSH